MIKGIGTDIIEIERIASLMKRSSFLKKLLTDVERTHLHKKINHPESIAGIFCAKEAFVKAMGTGFRNITLQDISILTDTLGAPYFLFSSQTENWLAQHAIQSRFLTISHCQSFATATVVLTSD